MEEEEEERLKMYKLNGNRHFNQNQLDVMNGGTSLTLCMPIRSTTLRRTIES